MPIEPKRLRRAAEPAGPLAKLSELQAQLLATVSDGSDPLPIFMALDQINAWTEGYTEVSPDLDFFTGRDALVEAALEAAKPVGT